MNSNAYSTYNSGGFNAIFSWPNAVLSVWKQLGQKLTVVPQGWTGNVQPPCTRFSPSSSLRTMSLAPAPHCSHCLSTVLLQVTVVGRQREHNDSLELYKPSPEQGLEHFLRFQPMCQCVSMCSSVPTLHYINIRAHFPNHLCQCLFPYQGYLGVKINNRMSSEKGSPFLVIRCSFYVSKILL